MNAIKAFIQKKSSLMAMLGAAISLTLPGSHGSHMVPVIRDKDVKGNPHLASYQWPTQEQMKAALVPDAAKTPAGVRALNSIRMVIRPKALPDDLAGRFVGMRHYLYGYDAGLIRYKTEGFLTQLVVTSSGMTLLVRDTGTTKRVTKDELLRFVHAVINRFFNESEALLKTDLTLVEEATALRGINPDMRDGRKRDNLHSWTQTLEWWTNGELVWFWLRLHPGAAEGGRKDWFSYTYRKKPAPRNKEDSPAEALPWPQGNDG
jgi:hypothetical protein